MQLESPAAMRYQVHELRQQILDTTDDIEAIQLEKLQLQRDEVNLLKPKVRTLYLSLLNVETDLNMLINFNIKFKNEARIQSDIMQLIHDHQKYFNPMQDINFRNLALLKLSKLSKGEIQYLFELHNRA